MDKTHSITPWPLEVVVLTLAIAMLPFYVFSSGGIQPTHIAFLLLTIITILHYGLPMTNWGWLLLLLSAYSFLIEAIYGAFSIYGDPSHLIIPAFFLFNFILSIGVYQVVLRKGTSVVWVGILAAAIFAVVSVYVSGVDLKELSDSGRSTGTFNNPNQLGYFSACLLSLSYLLYQHKSIRFLTLLGLLAASIFLAAASLSKAAIIANFLVLAFALRPKISGYAVTVWLGLAIALLIGMAYLLITGHFDDFLFYNRIVSMGSEQDSSLEARGYFAFLNGSLLQIIIGMGSSEVFWIVGHEVHSTFASIMNSYGIVGLALFLAIYVIWGRTLYRAYGFAGMIVIMGPATLYGITHNGTRFSIFWLLFSASMAMAVRELSLRNIQNSRLQASLATFPKFQQPVNR